MTRMIKSNSGQRNKFTEGLDFASIVDWTSELRPSMKKLRQAMDGLLKTARLTHSVFRVQEDPKMAQRACNVRYRRDVCFSQAVSFFYLSFCLYYSSLDWLRFPRSLHQSVILSLNSFLTIHVIISSRDFSWLAWYRDWWQSFGVKDPIPCFF